MNPDFVETGHKVKHRFHPLACLLALICLSGWLGCQSASAQADAAKTDASSAEEPSAESDAVQAEDADASGNDEETPAPLEFDDIPWEQRPYRVLISLAFADRDVMDEAFCNQISRSLGRIVDGEIGRYWQPTLQINDWLFPQSRDALAQLTGESLTSQFEATDFDKVLILTISGQGPTYRLAGCEWDRLTQSRGPIQERQLVDRRRTARVMFELLAGLFRPAAQIELAEGTFSELRIRGGELIGPDSALFPFQPGDLLTGHFRYLDRDRNVRQIQTVPFTYLQIDEINRSRMTATIESAFSNSLSGSRRRVELVALRIEPAYQSTRVMLSPRTNPNMPLVGVRVRVYSELPSEENPQPEHIDLMTDRDGMVVVPAYPERPLRRLIVHSGGAVLTNVPFVPGVDPEVAMQLPDDSPRLQVEGSLAMVQGDLIDVVSRRVVMLARAVSQARKEKFDEADTLLAEVDAQPSIASFESRILAIRVPAVDRARANRDRAQEKRIRMMCQELEDLVHKYLDRQKVDETKEEIRELKQLAGK